MRKLLQLCYYFSLSSTMVELCLGEADLVERSSLDPVMGLAIPPRMESLSRDRKLDRSAPRDRWERLEVAALLEMVGRQGLGFFQVNNTRV